MVKTRNCESTDGDERSLAELNKVLIIPVSDVEKQLGDADRDVKCPKVDSSTTEVKTFNTRWLQLLLFFLCGASNGIHWYHFTVVNNVARRYYGVSSLAIEWTTTIFMLTYVVLLVPASYLMDRVGLRLTVLIGATGTCIGSWIKVLATSPDGFVVAFIGQCFFAVSYLFILTVPGRLAAYWFGTSQIALATTIGFFGPQAGYVICVLSTSMLVQNHERIEDIGNDYSRLFWAGAIACSIVTVILFLLFQDEPGQPPSTARALAKVTRESRNTEGYLSVYKRVLSNKNFLMLWNSFGLLLGAVMTMGTMLNPFYMIHFKDDEKGVGILSFFSILTGCIGSAVCGAILDKTKAFRVISIVASCTSIFGAILFATSFVMEIKWMLFASYILFGGPVLGYSTVAMDLCAEITYPEPEAITTGILNMATQLYGFLLVLITGRVLEAFGDVAGHGCVVVSLVLGTVLVILNKGELRRQKAGQSATVNETHAIFPQE
ncbi:uncharacterized MFS-type transporter C09D4.1-like [Neodiprion lecontei]|uniref:Uncharacterized MFS-type transporter C09D4.1-like n=1 Tax=Neodiprion lecontei TaxID=441921 RepID=A0ABM3GKI1_NEOLC|nr:uncharacterized MFS-type transporter C09D4.1-like [Neodiprion lecontei]